jgi:predicted amidohydrolase YtcJ
MADLVVLADNPLTCPQDKIKEIPVDLTIVGGRAVYERIEEGGSANVPAW